MNNAATPPETPAVRPLLVRSDLIRFEHIITGTLERFFSFKTHSIYFPRGHSAPQEPRRLLGESKVLIPLNFNGETLGVFAGRGVRLPRGALPLLGHIADLCMENLALHKRGLTDSLTGLYTREYLLDNMAGVIALQRADFLPASAGKNAAGTDSTAVGAPAADPAKRSGLHNFAVLTVQLRGLQRIAAEYGYMFLEKVLTRLAAEFAALAPEQALATRVSDGEFGLYLPEGTPKACRALGRDIVARLSALTFSHELSGSTASIAAAAGYACYPQQADLPSPAHGAADPDFPLDLDQARSILRKARQAAYVAAMEFAAAPQGQTLGFEQILTSGGRIREVLPYGQMRVNLGRDVGAKVGQCFAVWGADPARAGFDPLKADSTALVAAAYRGELVLTSVDKHESAAELFHQADPARPALRGDYLTLLPEGAFLEAAPTENAASSASAAEQKSAAAINTDSAATSDTPDAANASAAPVVPGPKILDRQTFIERLAMARENSATCALALLRLDILNWTQSHDQPLNLAELTARAAAVCRARLPADTLAGAYGMHSFIFFHPALNEDAALALYEGLTQAVSESVGVDCACGISLYPYLNYRRSELIDNCRKALNYAMLLPGPKVGLFNSLALNISADKLFSQGDPFAAIQEYKQALLADDKNSMAWISLGVCLAGVGRKNDARDAFEQALRLAPPAPQDVMAMYNLGQIHQDLGESKDAAAYYRRCLKRDPEYVYAALRLGQLAEGAGRFARARRWYAKALELPGGKGPAQRRLARLALRLDNHDEAREHLHQALLADPQDAMALNLLARLYLDAGEDPEVALALARQSVSLRPHIRANWQELARALEASGRPEDARQARLKAAEL